MLVTELKPIIKRVSIGQKGNGRLCVPITHLDPGLSGKTGNVLVAPVVVESIRFSFALLRLYRNPLWHVYIAENLKIIVTKPEKLDWICYHSL